MLVDFGCVHSMLMRDNWRAFKDFKKVHKLNDKDVLDYFLVKNERNETSLHRHARSITNLLIIPFEFKWSPDSTLDYLNWLDKGPQMESKAKVTPAQIADEAGGLGNCSLVKLSAWARDLKNQLNQGTVDFDKFFSSHDPVLKENIPTGIGRDQYVSLMSFLGKAVGNRIVNPRGLLNYPSQPSIRDLSSAQRRFGL
jgi:hypothetical protein